MIVNLSEMASILLWRRISLPIIRPALGCFNNQWYDIKVAGCYLFLHNVIIHPSSHFSNDKDGIEDNTKLKIYTRTGDKGECSS